MLSGISKKGLSVVMALLMSVSTVGVLSYTAVDSGSLVVSAASTYSEELNIGEELLVDIEKTQTVKSSNESVVQLVVTSMGSVKCIRMKAIGVGTAKVTVYDSAGKAVEITNITVKGSVVKKEIEVFTDGFQTIKTDKKVKSILNSNGSKIVNSEKFGVSIVNGGFVVWGNPGEYNIKVTTDVVTNYKIKLKVRTYEYAKGVSNNIKYNAGIKSLKSSNSSVVKLQKRDNYTYNISCLANGESTIYVSYSNGKSETYKIKVRDAKQNNINSGAIVYTGTSKKVSYSKYLPSGVRITKIRFRGISQYVTVSKEVNSITYKLANAMYKPECVASVIISLSNGDALIDTVRFTEYVLSNNVYTYKNLEFDLSKVNVEADVSKAKIKSYTCTDSKTKNYISIEKTDTKLVFKKNTENSKHLTVPVKVVLNNGIEWYIKVNVIADNQRAEKIAVNTSKTIDFDREILSVNVENNEANFERTDDRVVTTSYRDTKLAIKGINKGKAQVRVRLKGDNQRTIVTAIINPSNKTYNKTIGYNKSGTKIAVDELKGSGATIAEVKVDDSSKMGVTRYDYSILLKPKKAGKSTVTVTCTNGDVIKYVCTVNSLNKKISKSVTLNTKSAQTFDVNKDMSLKAKGLKVSKVENKSTALLKDIKKSDYNFSAKTLKKGTATVNVTLSNGDILKYNITIK